MSPVCQKNLLKNLKHQFGKEKKIVDIWSSNSPLKHSSHPQHVKASTRPYSRMNLSITDHRSCRRLTIHRQTGGINTLASMESVGRGSNQKSTVVKCSRKCDVVSCRRLFQSKKKFFFFFVDCFSLNGFPPVALAGKCFSLLKIHCNICNMYVALNWRNVAKMMRLYLLNICSSPMLLKPL